MTQKAARGKLNKEILWQTFPTWHCRAVESNFRHNKAIDIWINVKYWIGILTNMMNKSPQCRNFSPTIFVWYHWHQPQTVTVTVATVFWQIPFWNFSYHADLEAIEHSICFLIILSKNDPIRKNIYLIYIFSRFGLRFLMANEICSRQCRRFCLFGSHLPTGNL